MNEYEVEVWETRRRVAYIKATSGRNARIKLREEVRPSGMIRQTVKSVLLIRKRVDE